jgi:hypothetical protein
VSLTGHKRFCNVESDAYAAPSPHTGFIVPRTTRLPHKPIIPNRPPPLPFSRAAFISEYQVASTHPQWRETLPTLPSRHPLKGRDYWRMLSCPHSRPNNYELKCESRAGFRRLSAPREAVRAGFADCHTSQGDRRELPYEGGRARGRPLETSARQML